MNPRKNARYVQQLNIFFGNQSLCNRFFKKLSGTYNKSCGLYHEPPQVGNSLGGIPVVSFMFIRHKYYDSSITVLLSIFNPIGQNPDEYRLPVHKNCILVPIRPDQSCQTPHRHSSSFRISALTVITGSTWVELVHSFVSLQPEHRTTVSSFDIEFIDTSAVTTQIVMDKYRHKVLV